MSTAELQAIVEKLAVSQAATDRQMKETDRQMQTTDRQMQATDRRMKETDKQLKELGKQIGGLGRKFGSFTEGLSYASIEKILKEGFGLEEFVTPAVKMRKGGREEEYDVLAYSNGTLDQGMIVEVKSRLRQEDIDQMKRKMDEVFFWLPEHKNKTFYGNGCLCFRAFGPQTTNY